MAVAKDWALEAAKAIQWFVGYSAGEPAEAIEKLRDIIAKHCPFKPGVAYMPMPRCETCAHWIELPYYWGRCNPLAIETPPDFGCVQWKAK